jgi:hypothetical protein
MEAVPWNKWPRFLMAGIFGAVVVCSSGFLLSTLVPAEAGDKKPVKPDQTITQTGPNSVASQNQHGGQTASTIYNAPVTTIINKEYQYSGPQPAGILSPGHDPIPQTDDCNPPWHSGGPPPASRTITVYVAGFAYVPDRLPFTAIEIGGTPLVSVLPPAKSKRIGIALDVYGEDGKIRY